MLRASAELTVAIPGMATPAQREHAWQKFDDLMHDFTELSKENGAKQSFSEGGSAN
jgi:hypothetical protein